MPNRANDDNIKIAIDFETSGFGANACALGLARVEGGEVVEDYYTLIRPPSTFINFTAIHGLTWKDLKKAPIFTEVWSDICNFIDSASALIAHNARFDRMVLTACCQHFDLVMPDLPFLCTLKGARKCYKLRYNKLSDVCDYLDIDLNHHNAASDARACALIYANLKRKGLTDQDMLL